jgi:hypothetical protein
MKRITRRIAIGLTGVALALGSVACTSGVSSSQSSSQSLTEKIAASATDPGKGGVAYPYDDMAQGGWREEQMLAEHLKRQASPKTQRWIVVTTQMGQILGQWPIQGMVFDPNSQMTAPKIATCTPNTGGGGCGAVVDAPGDNGTYGPEAGSAAFYTTTGVEIQMPAGAIWFESDAPLGLTQAPLITYNANSTPSFNGGGVHIGQ